MNFLVNALLTTLFCIGLNDPGKNPGTYQDYVLQQLKPDCWYNWAIYSEDNLKNPSFNPMLWVVNEGNLKTAVNLASKYPGRTWLIYNEPEGSDQSNTKPEDAAIWFDKAYKAIKDADSTATVACCGVMVRNEGIDWLDKFVKSAKYKPDVWHIHIYINSVEMSDWLAFWNWFLWWNDKAGNNLPVYVTETCSTYQPIQDKLLLSLLDYKHPLLKRVYWFSAYHEPIVNDWKCNLLNDKGELLNLGKLFQSRLSNKLTPVPEPTKTPEATKTPIPTNTPTPTITPIPSPSPTATIDPGETTNEPIVDEPMIYIYEIYIPLIQN